MRDPWRQHRLARRLTGAMLLVTVLSLAVMFVGTVVPHLLAEPPSPDDAVSTGWLLVASLVATVTAVVLSVVMARRLTGPIDGYIDAARRFAAGDHGARPLEPGPPELADLTEALASAAAEIERSEDNRRRLTADIAHELRTPLTTLQAGLEELRDGHVPRDRAALASLHDQATRLGRVVNDLEELAAAESDSLGLDLAAVDLARIAELALAANASSLEAAGLVVRRDFAPDVVVVADADRMHQVVGNLLANAALYCRPGDRVAVRVRAQGGEGCLEVSDTGPGFSPEEIPHVFDRVWRGSASVGTHGSGLGLPIVRALVVAQGGSVAVGSDGTGATISVRLPRAETGVPAP